MLVVNPEERASINDVVDYCSSQLQQLEMKLGKNVNYLSDSSASGNTPGKGESQKGMASQMGTIDGDQNGSRMEMKPLIDPCLIMEDIIEKL